jgi:hypothetical protein
MADSLRAGPASVGHGVDCVSLVLDGRHPGAAVLTPDESDRLADLLHEQAQQAREAAGNAMWAHTDGTNP